MAVTPTPIYPQTIYNAVQTLANADGTSVKALTTSQTNGIKIESVLASSSDTTARDVCLYLTIASTNYLLSQVQVPITAGQSNGASFVNLLTGAFLPGSVPLSFDSNGNQYLYLAAGTTLSISAPVAVTSTKVINVFAIGEAF